MQFPISAHLTTLALFLTVSDIWPVFGWKMHIFPTPSILL